MTLSHNKLDGNGANAYFIVGLVRKLLPKGNISSNRKWN